MAAICLQFRLVARPVVNYYVPAALQLSSLSSAVAIFCCIWCCREEVGMRDGRRLVLSWRCRHEGDALRQVVRLRVNRAWGELAATEVIVDVALALCIWQFPAVHLDSLFDNIGAVHRLCDVPSPTWSFFILLSKNNFIPEFCQEPRPTCPFPNTSASRCSHCVVAVKLSVKFLVSEHSYQILCNIVLLKNNTLEKITWPFWQRGFREK